MTRRGITLLETMVAGILVVAMMTVCLQMLRATAAQHRATEDRQMAIQEAANLMERLSTRPWDELTPQNVQQMQLSPQARRTLIDAELEIQLNRPPDDPAAKRITVSVRWSNRSGKAARTVRLVAWRYRTI